jgi:hypothetical protein
MPRPSVVALGLVGAWWATRPRRVHVNFVTHPFEATVLLNDILQTDAAGNPYRTPCTIKDLPARVHHVAFEHDALGRLDAGPWDFASQRRVEKRWGPPAPPEGGTPAF